MLDHLPILQVIVPLLAAPACLLLNKPRISWLFACFAAVISLLISAALLNQVQHSGVISYMLGGWEAPWGIEYRIDLLSAYVLLIVSAIGTIVLLAANTGIRNEIDEDKQSLFYVLYLLCMAGLLGIVATGDIFNVFVFLEISSLATYALVAFGRDRRALLTAYQYLIVGTIGATFLLMGIGLLYSLTGTLNMQDIANRLPLVSETSTAYTAFVFMIVGVALKLALFPLHLWLPNTYTYAPSIVTAFLAATATKVAIYLLIRLHFSIFGDDFGGGVIQTVFIALGLLSVFVASTVAIKQPNIKRLFAYSSVAQIGYMIIGIGIGTSLGLQGTLLHLFNHALMKGALFLALAAVVYRIGSTDRACFNGLAKHMPWTMAAVVIAGLSLIGVPLTVGFISKWYLVLASLQSGLWPVALLIVIGSLLAVYYVWTLVESAYFGKADPSLNSASSPPIKEAPLGLLIPLWILVLANVYFGIDTRLPLEASAQAANMLMGAGQ
ncbi:monovalent cation/H+ antiporter subunit D family protein [Paraglaciecola arctica]|uniref:NADH-quinone oxidoreductase subunit N n=1 Tax=Paraglaciecola arctica BSs20135 TaxID=493475 RepID=K6YPD4_9ALTE|nr:monovalent cation/H+ antiporter subunit D family protein [Paraglaciecola arctica]GAC18498.1 NADH-quinone oxidoreductase subunit N [Paraglaciecola arctica BSs20135]